MKNKSSNKKNRLMALVIIGIAAFLYVLMYFIVANRSPIAVQTSGNEDGIDATSKVKDVGK